MKTLNNFGHGGKGMKKDSRIKLDKEKSDKIIEDIINYFADERDEQIGSLQASMLLDFFIESIGTEVYNQGIADAQRYMNEKVDDLYGLML